MPQLASRLSRRARTRPGLNPDARSSEAARFMARVSLEFAPVRIPGRGSHRRNHPRLSSVRSGALQLPENPIGPAEAILVRVLAATRLRISGHVVFLGE